MRAQPLSRWLPECYREDIFRFIASRVGGEADAADLAQQTLLQAFVKLHAFRGGDIRSWIFSIASHLLVDFYRAQGRATFVSIDDEPLQRTERKLQTPSLSVQSHCAAQERIQCCLACIRTLMPPVEQVAVLLSDVHGFTNKEAAARLHMSLSLIHI